MILEYLLYVVAILLLIFLPNILGTGEWIQKNKGHVWLRIAYFFAVCLPALVVLVILIAIENIVHTLLSAINHLIEFLTKGVFGAEKS